ncbi:multiubiquitin domain-containing protein [Bradyrhizobium brasilense]|uniref:multiubiquitin domain-containing protein n=1 Tax=Bradyrhizobium brasilense TaxID=1419277 RepID=UPI0024B08ACA|nr:multiubiquitin domain-containing protein [Bradyrhizobium australafricanum]WFU32395.1 multiubiquitin domain-containing protein [Bradyrhizobium australafricanum]
MANDKEKEVKIVVNGTEHPVAKGTLTFDELTQIAFPGHPTDPNIVFSVTYDKAAQKPDHGSLLPGQEVEVKNHTVFDVTQTNRS